MHIVAELFRLTDRCKLECSAAILGCGVQGIRIIRRFKSHAVSEICTVVFV